MPRNHDNKDWQAHLGADFERTYNEYLHTLGNVTLTGYNETLSDNPLAKKQEQLRECKTKIQFLNKEFFESKKWDEEVIKARAERLSEKTLVIFSMPTWSGKNYHPINETVNTRITFQNADDCSGMRAVSYEFMGKQVGIKSFCDALVGVTKALYESHGAIIQEMSQKNISPFSHSKGNLRAFEVLENTEIYINKHGNGPHLIKLIKKILDYCKIEESEFVLNCKRTPKEIKKIALYTSDTDNLS